MPPMLDTTGQVPASYIAQLQLLHSLVGVSADVAPYFIGETLEPGDGVVIIAEGYYDQCSAACTFMVELYVGNAIPITSNPIMIDEESGLVTGCAYDAYTFAWGLIP